MTPDARSTKVASATSGQGVFRAYDEAGHTATITVTWFGPPA